MQWFGGSQLKSKDSHQRAQAVARLAKTSGRRPTRPVLTALIDDAAEVRLEALRVALGWRDEKTTEVLNQLLKHPEEWVRERAVAELGKVGLPEALVFILPSLCDMSTPVRTAAIQSLSTLGWRPETPGERALECIGRGQFGKAAGQGRVALELLLPFVAHPTNSVRQEVAEALGAIRDAQSTAALEKLLADPDPAVRITAIQGIKRMPAPVAALCKAVQDWDKNVRVAAVEALGQLRDSEAVPIIAACLQDESWSVRCAAAIALGQMGERSSIPLLVQSLKDSDADVRVAVSEALGAIGDVEAIEPLVMAQLDPETSVRQAALKAAVRVDHRWYRNARAYRALPALKAAARSDVYSTRGAAAELLDRIFSIRRRAVFRESGTDARMLAAEILIPCLWDDEPMLAGAAAEALGHLRSQRALEVLKAKAQDGEPWVKKFSASAVALIEGPEAGTRGWRSASNG
jgi:HEAT repeat protein